MTITDLERNQVIRQALETAALKLELQNGNDSYRQAYRIAARIVRAMKPD